MPCSRPSNRPCSSAPPPDIHPPMQACQQPQATRSPPPQSPFQPSIHHRAEACTFSCKPHGSSAALLNLQHHNISALAGAALLPAQPPACWRCNLP
mmetsp:Transcript_4423/g.12033  ORF Transcript_4423/g.12033 Transcript_4423/m.12033 type:complete len:96 (+) Transcript_4423:1091-1378(+)